ncbi:hypothetical protein NX029_08090 [Cytobacillus firmus]|nr:hypothetical protein [Cytobacillus firmus]
MKVLKRIIIAVILILMLLMGTVVPIAYIGTIVFLIGLYLSSQKKKGNIIVKQTSWIVSAGFILFLILGVSFVDTSETIDTNGGTQVANTTAQDGSKQKEVEIKEEEEEKAKEEASIAAEEKAKEEARIAAEEKAKEEARIAAEEKAKEEARIAAEEKAKEEAASEQTSSNLLFDPFGPDRDCSDFPSGGAEAQEFYIAAGGPTSDPHDLDRDNDGNACDWN